MRNSVIFKRIFALVLVLSMICALMLTTSCSKNKNYSSSDKDIDLGFNTNIPSLEGMKDGSGGRDSFISNLGGVSETYEGSVSKLSYSTPKEAAEAYVAEEIAGESELEVINTTSKGELSSSKINSLGIPKDMQDGITSVEELEVEYSLATEGIVSTADKLDTSKKVTVYVIKYSVDWKYFTPAPVTGDTITKSYYDSVFNYEKYKNCTLETSVLMSIVASGTDGIESMSMTMEVSLTQFIKHADNKVYLEQTAKTSYDGETEEETIYAYMEEVNGRVICYVKTDPSSDSWYETNLSTIGFSSLDELTPFYDQYLDYTYFTKTNYGFALEKENAEQYIMQALAGSGFDSFFGADGLKIDMFAEYYVSGGVLSGMRMDADIKIDVVEQGVSVSATEVVKGTTTVTNYGTTVVEKPFTE